MHVCKYGSKMVEVKIALARELLEIYEDEIFIEKYESIKREMIDT
jgi:hypothetical protein